MGAPDGVTNPGSVLVYRGTPFGYDPWTTIALEAQAGAAFGAVVSAWDLNEDGYADLAIGAPGAAAGTGKVYVVPGSMRGLNGAGAVTLTGVANNGESGLPGDKLAIASMNIENPGNAGFDHLLVATSAGVSYFVGAFDDIADEPQELLTSPDDTGRGFGATMLTNVPNGLGERTLLVAAPRQFSGASQSGRVYSFLADEGNPNAFALTRVLDKAEGAGSENPEPNADRRWWSRRPTTPTAKAEAGRAGGIKSAELRWIRLGSAQLSKPSLATAGSTATAEHASRERTYTQPMTHCYGRARYDVRGHSGRLSWGCAPVSSSAARRPADERARGHSGGVRRQE